MVSQSPDSLASDDFVPVCQCHSCTEVQKSGHETPGAVSFKKKVTTSFLLAALLVILHSFCCQCMPLSHVQLVTKTHWSFPEELRRFLLHYLFFFFFQLVRKYIIVVPVPSRKLHWLWLNFMRSF